MLLAWQLEGIAEGLSPERYAVIVSSGLLLAMTILCRFPTVAGSFILHLICTRHVDAAIPFWEI